MNKQDVIGHALIKFSEAEIDLILTALYNTEKLSIPRVKSKWKRPYTNLIKELLLIKETLEKEKERQQ
jgi:hypothetical protein